MTKDEMSAAEHAYTEWQAKQEAIKQKLRTFHGLVLDADGVFFDGKETRTAIGSVEGTVSKTRDFRDGQGISFLRALGVRILFASGEGEPLGSIVRKLNELPSCVSGGWAPVECMTGLKQGKVSALADFADRHSLGLEDIVYIGDDRTDTEAMGVVRKGGGLVVAPADAQRVVKKYIDLHLQKSGGAGAIREFAEMVCDARGVDEETLATA